jgi:hypothetical protein
MEHEKRNGGGAAAGASSSSAGPDVGKQARTDALDVKPTATIGPSGPTGNKYIDSGAVCDRDGPGCFLSSAQRARLITVFIGQVHGAASNCQVAISALQIEQLLKKDEDLSWLMDLVLEVVGGQVVKFATEAAKKMLANAPATLARYGVDVTEETIKKFAESTDLIAQVKSVAGRVKTTSALLFKTDKNSEGKRRKSEAKNYLDHVAKEADRAFQTIRTTLPAMLRDGDLIAAYYSFDVENHSVESYEETIRGKMDRYLSSGVTRIGSEIEMATRLDDKPHMSGVQTDRRVAWATTPTSKTPLLYFVDNITSDGAGHQGAEEPVPREFWDAAISRHRAMWGTKPEKIELRSQSSAIAGVVSTMQERHDNAEDHPSSGQFVGSHP